MLTIFKLITFLNKKIANTEEKKEMEEMEEHYTGHSIAPSEMGDIIVPILSTILAILFAIITTVSYICRSCKMNRAEKGVLISRWHEILASFYALLVINFDVFIGYFNRDDFLISIWIFTNLLAIVPLFISCCSKSKYRIMLYIPFVIHMTGTGSLVLGSILINSKPMHIELENWDVAVFALSLFIVATYLSFSIPSLFKIDAPKMEFEKNSTINKMGVRYVVVGSETENQTGLDDL